MRQHSLGFLLAVTSVGLLLQTRNIVAQTPPSDHFDAPPVAPVRPVIDDYFGTSVSDPYRYMEDLKSPEVTDWFQGQSDYTRSVLEGLRGRVALFEEIKKYDEGAPAITSDVRRLPNERYFYQKRFANEDVPKLYMRDGLKGQEKVLVDPARYAEGNTHWSISYYQPSWDGNYVAVGLAAGGSEGTIIHFFDIQNGRELSETIDRARIGAVNWRADNHSLYYNRLRKLPPDADPAERETKSRAYLHELGTDPEKDQTVFGYEISPAITMKPSNLSYVWVPRDSKYAFAVIGTGLPNELSMYFAPLANVTDVSAPWRKLFDADDEITNTVVHGEDIYLQSHKGASRYQVLHTKLSAPDVDHADVVLPAGEAVIRNFAAAKDALYIQELDGGISRLIRIPYGSKPQEVKLPFAGSLNIASADPRLPGILFNLGSWTKTTKIYSYDPTSNQIVDIGLQPAGRFDDPSNLESVEVKAKSHDGTMVPLSIVYRKGTKLDGSNPTILKAYGGYGITQEPYFDPRNLAWFEQGGIIAVAHVRGGGEYGEDWHLGGKGPTKPNTWKDFIACAEYLIANKYTSSSKLAVQGGSAGGITVGRAITDRPELFAVAIDQVPVSDTLRFELSPIGPTNTEEFGSVKTQEGFRALYEMSPYQHVKDAVAYPAVIIATGFNDPRVSSWEPGKLAARLQAATSSGKPILLRVDYDAGHGIGSTKTQRQMEMADEMSFALWQFGAPGFQPSKE